MGSYEIEWIGTGSGLNPVLGNTSFLLRGNGDRVLLVDCGATVPTALLGTGRIAQVTDILITHAHGDHFHGLEAVGFFSYFALRRRGDARPRLHFPGAHVAASVRTALEVSMGLVLDDEGRDQQMSLMDYFAPITQDVLALPGLPGVRCVSRRHVGRLENFGLDIDGGVYYSGDTVELPPPGPALIFQDCQFFEGGPGTVHISYQRLSQELSPEVKARTHLVHLGGGWDTVDVVADGFAGIVRPGDRFVIPLSAADPEAAR